MKVGKEIIFRVKIDDQQISQVTLKVDLRSFEEVNMAIKYSSLLKCENPAIKHFEIPFTACISTEHDKPCPFKGDVFQRFSDSDTVVYKISRYRKDRKFLYVKLEVQQDCLLKVTGSALFNADLTHRMSVIRGSRPSSMQETFKLGETEAR